MNINSNTQSTIHIANKMVFYPKVQTEIKNEEEGTYLDC